MANKILSNRVWIELERLKNNAEGHLRALLASNMLRRLSDASNVRDLVFWIERKQLYGFTIDSAGGFVEAIDNGHWFNLDYFGRPE